MVLSPGSRNAPLTISFARNQDITTYNIVDERSAGFIALGMAQKSNAPVAICCTSGSALLNYAPAVSEAYYQNIPLIVLSADRPPEWIDQRDGQTINQDKALHNFVKGSFNLPVDLEHADAQWEFERKVNDAINLATTAPYGPVHINVPFREPFYPKEDQELEFGEVRIINHYESNKSTGLEELVDRWKDFPKKLIIQGQRSSHESALSVPDDIPVIADVISNSSQQDAVRTHDLFLGALTQDQLESLQPDLLITTGKSIISKNLKLYLRNFKPRAHWHFEDAPIAADTFQSLSDHFRFPLNDLLDVALSKEPNEFKKQLGKNFKQSWFTIDKLSREAIDQSIEEIGFSEASAYFKVLNSMPDTLDLHFANSMAVRYSNFFHYTTSNQSVYANRGTSGIDGTNGTAVGNAILADRPVVLLTGDLSFFYDRNAFLHNYDLSHLKIIVFNNQGGGIFRMIKGPAALPELEQHFETRHNHSAQFAAAEYRMDYIKVKDVNTLESGLASLFADNKSPKIMEVFTDPAENKEAFAMLKQSISDRLNTH